MPGVNTIKSALAIVLAAAVPWLGPAAAGDPPAAVNIGYFQQWPAPIQFAQENRTLDAMLATRVNWLPFRSGREMTAALAAGDLQIAFSLGHVPFLAAVDSGVDLTVVGIAVSYPENDNCILRADAGIDRGSAGLLAGQTVALRPGSVSHFRLLKMLEHLGVNPAAVKIEPVADGDAALGALRRGEAVMACGSGAALRRMRELGKPLMSGAEQQALGLKLFDVIAVSNAFLREHADIVQAFMDVNEAANEQWRGNPRPMLRMIARAAYMDRERARDTMRGMHFPLAAEQKSAAWLGSGVSAYSGELARFFVDYGQLDASQDSYDRFVTTRFLR
jgi:taurine transport system substrate-binding protein